MIENLSVEFKELDHFRGTLPESTAKEIAAFANTAGGTMYIGIKDDKKLISKFGQIKHFIYFYLILFGQ